MVLYEKKMTRRWKKKSAIVGLVLAVLALLFPLPLRASAAVISPDGWGWQLLELDEQRHHKPPL